LTWFFRRYQERHDRIGDDIRGSPGQVMTRAFDELQASIGQGAGEPTGGIDGNQGVPGIGEQENRRLDRRDGLLQLTQLAEQGALLGQECAPQPSAFAACAAPDLPVDVLVRAQRAAAPPADPGEPGPGDPWRQPPRHQRAQLPGAGCGEQPVPAVHASGANAREQDHRLHPVGRQARRRQRHPATVGVPHQHRALDAAQVQVIEHGVRIRGEPAGGKLAGAVSRPVSCDRVELDRQPSGDLLPVGGGTGLPMQQHQLVSAQPGRLISGFGISGHGGVLFWGHAR
jgi:hypothetical protein